MGLARFLGRVGPPISLFVPAMLVSAVIPAALTTAAPVARVDCRSVTPYVAARESLASSGGTPASTSVRAQLNTQGELSSRTLTAQSGSSAPVSVTLPTESFVGRPAGNVVVYTRYSPTSGSEVRLLNPVTGCDTRLAAPTEIVRSAVLDKTASSAFVHSVTRAGRADAGIMRYELQSGVGAQLIAPLPASAELGPIFGTDLRWSVDGNDLAVQSCGFSTCLTRVLDLWTGSLSEYSAAGQGAFIALSSEHLVTYANCGGLPCDVLSTDLSTGAIAVIAADAIDVRTSASGPLVTLTIQSSAGQMEVVQ